MHFDLDRFNRKKFEVFKIQHGSVRHLKKSKNLSISASVRANATKFGTLMHLSQPALVLILL